MPSSSKTISSRAPNSMSARSCMLFHSHSASPRLRRVVSPGGLFIAQCHAQLAEQTEEMAMGGVG